MRIASQLLNVCVATALCVSANPAVFAADTPDGDDPVVVNTKAGSALEALPPKPLEQRLAVTIYEFHSGSPDVSVTAATDMFTTALVKSGQFRVVERQRLNQGVVYEKQLNAAGQTSGDTAQKQLRGARYIFEGTVTEANASENQRQTGVSIGGLTLGGGKNKDTIAIDVRILDAESGDVVDSVSVSKTLNDKSSGISGTAALANTIASLRGKAANPLTPDVNYQSSHKESLDRALRACIETSVLTLIKRVSP
jgi:curli biogenesis system outer membrane secretion channel CsgG